MADGEPEDWPAHPAELRQLDRSLRCAVCYDLYTGPVALPCSHTFCSRCIRDSLNVRLREGQPAVCPSCRKPCDQADLRPVSHLREASTAWKVVRHLLLTHHLQALQQQPQQQLQQQQQPLLQQDVQRNGRRLSRKQSPPQAHGGKPPLQNGRRLSRTPPSTSATAAAATASRPAAASKTAAAGHQDCITIIEDSEECSADNEPEEGRCSTDGDANAAAAVTEGGVAVGAGNSPAAAAASGQTDSAEVGWSEGEEEEGTPLPGAPSTAHKTSSTPKQHVNYSSSAHQHQRARRSSSSSPLPAAAAAAGGGRHRARSSSDCEQLGNAANVGGGCDEDAGADDAGSGSSSEGFDDEPAADDSADSDFRPEDADADEGLPAAKRQKRTTAPGGAVLTCDSRGKENHSNSYTKQQQHKVHATPAPPPQQQPGYVACPICGMSVRESFINSHVDTCLERAGGAAAVAPSAPSARPPARQAASNRTSTVPNGPGPTAAAAAAAAGGGGVGSDSSKWVRQRRQGGGVLEPPPKLCFELIKERDLKAKLTGLGLSNDGNKKACVDRYTAFRNYVLSLKDSSSSLSLKEAAAEFTRQQRRITRAASRPQAVDATIAAATAAGGAGGGSSMAAVVAAAGAAEADGGAALDNSFAVLIQETRLREKQRKERQQQRDQQQPGSNGGQVMPVPLSQQEHRGEVTAGDEPVGQVGDMCMDDKQQTTEQQPMLNLANGADGQKGWEEPSGVPESDDEGCT